MTAWKETKLSILSAENVNEIDDIIQSRTGFKTLQSKIAFVTGMFDVKIPGKMICEYDEADYWKLLQSIVDIIWD